MTQVYPDEDPQLGIEYIVLEFRSKVRTHVTVAAKPLANCKHGRKGLRVKSWGAALLKPK